MTRESILFVCMGNICRSPLAEAVFQHLVTARGVAGRFSVDSAGTSAWHVGEPADARMRAVAESRGIVITSRSRQVRPSDFATFDLIVCMDENNRDDLLSMGAPEDKLALLLEFDESAKIVEVPDPYYGGVDGFESVYGLVDRACQALLESRLEAV